MQEADTTAPPWEPRVIRPLVPTLAARLEAAFVRQADWFSQLQGVRDITNRRVPWNSLELLDVPHGAGNLGAEAVSVEIFGNGPLGSICGPLLIFGASGCRLWA